MNGPQCVSLAELLSMDIPAPRYLLGDLITERSIGMIAGPRGAGKSFLTSFIAYAVSGAKPLEPWGKGSGALVCYVDAEMRVHVFQNRLRLIHASNKKHPSIERVLANLHVVSRDLIAAPIGPIDTEVGRSMIDELIPTGTKLLILDNLSALSSEGREDATGFAGVKHWFMSLRDRGIAVLLVHHAGKSGKQRGTSAHEDLLDYSILLGVLPSNAERADTRFSIEHTKLRDDAPKLKKKYAFSIWTEDGVLQHEIEELTPQFSKVELDILRLHAKKVPQARIAREVGVSASKVSRFLASIKDDIAEEDGDDEDAES